MLAGMSILDRFRLHDKVAIVTGASAGLGVGFALGLAEAGADVALGARRVDRLEETKKRVEALGRRCIAVATDVSSPEACEQLVAECVGSLGRVDVLVNNAGVGSAVPATRETPEQFSHVIDVNLKGSYWMAQAAARAMAEGGSIINVGSILGETTMTLPQAAYSSSKAAIIGLSRDLAVQWTGRKGIRVNTLAPGIFPSEMTELYGDGYIESMMPRIPAGRVGEVEELVAAAVFLASDASSYVTGTVLSVDGGLLAT
jgi:NAD(P)-dependent dehydrogenase (short-subunit alcohol dehydrogenase family)